MNEKTTPVGLTIEECAEVLRAAGTDLILMAGQAVSLWVHEYREQLLPSQPFLSKDIDFWGNRASLTLLANRLQTDADYPDWRSFTLLSGIIRRTISGRLVNIDVLHTVPGLDEINEEKSAVELSNFGAKISILDPVSLIACKLHNLKTLDQTERNDGPQLEAAIRVARFFIADAFRLRGIRTGLNYCKRLLNIALISSNQATIKDRNVRIFEAIPIETIRAMSNDQSTPQESRERLQNFLNHRWSRLQASGAVS